MILNMSTVNEFIMQPLRELLQTLCHEVECQVKPALCGLLTGPIIRNNLPQSWLFKTENEEAIFHVDTQGNAIVQTERVSEIDVSIAMRHADLEQMIKVRQQPSGANPAVRLVTQKGQNAFNLLKQRFGFK